MNDRMTKTRLYKKLDMVNDELGFNREPLYRDESGNMKGNEGTIILDFAYGGVKVSRMSGGTGETDLSPRGNMRQAYDYLDAMETAARIMKGKRK